MEERTTALGIGEAVVFVDPIGRSHDAIVTHTFSQTTNPEERPSVNLVYVTEDETAVDQYGRQIERKTSVVHRSNQYANGMYWRFDDE